MAPPRLMALVAIRAADRPVTAHVLGEQFGLDGLTAYADLSVTLSQLKGEGLVVETDRGWAAI